jgi:hypothetical protein
VYMYILIAYSARFKTRGSVGSSDVA